jgi:hypothetical protein
MNIEYTKGCTTVDSIAGMNMTQRFAEADKAARPFYQMMVEKYGQPEPIVMYQISTSALYNEWQKFFLTILPDDIIAKWKIYLK